VAVAEETSTPAEIGENDIIFECPHCAKSLAIDPRGSGLMITCPDCGARIQVPATDEAAAENEQEVNFPSELEQEEVTLDRIRELRDAVTAYRTRIRQLTRAIEEMRKRRSYLERLRADHMQGFERIRDELAVIQGALDRMVTVLEDAYAGAPAETPEEEGE
jgi:predicted RNA-binding Zn-ribbon protein involved in translation (DUF1610 family)